MLSELLDVLLFQSPECERAGQTHSGGEPDGPSVTFGALSRVPGHVYFSGTLRDSGSASGNDGSYSTYQ